MRTNCTIISQGKKNPQVSFLSVVELICFNLILFFYNCHGYYYYYSTWYFQCLSLIEPSEESTDEFTCLLSKKGFIFNEGHKMRQ